MTEALPIACSLSAGDLKGRLAEIAAIGDDALIGHEAAEGRHALRFRADGSTRERLERIVDAEAECCPFLDLDLSEADGLLTLTLLASPEAGPVVEELATAFIGGTP
jgi:hypothetical protein